MSHLPPGHLDELRAIVDRLDPDGAPTDHPWRLAARNSLAALVPIALGGLARLLTYRGLTPFVAWWVWPAVAGLVVVVCFGHAALGLAIGRRRAGNVLKALLVLLLFVIVFWVTQQGGGRGR
jgi:hypothetical protein